MTDQTTPPPTRKGRGCFFYGCLTSIVLLLLVCVLAFFAFRWVRNQIYEFTDTSPAQLPKVEMADSEFQSIQQRVTAFHDAMQQGKPAEPLVLTEREINGIIAKSPDAKDIAGKVYVSLDGDQVKGKVSFPLDGFGWLAKGRYFNGEAAFNVSLENGVLIVTAQEVQVQGKPLPESFMSALRKENLAKNVYKNPEHAEAIRKFDSIQVEDSKLTIKARAAN